MREFYVYIHYRNDTNTPFYVGKGKGDRAYQLCTSRRSRFWLNIANKAGVTVNIIETALTETEAHDLECKIIEELRMYGYKLANLTDGGEGVSGRKISEHSRQLMRIKATGRIHTYATRQKLKARGRLTGVNNHMYGKTHTQETRLKISSKLSGRIPTQETIEKRTKSICKPVKCMETGIVFDSAISASAAIGRSRHGVANAICRGGKCSGLTFKYIEEIQ